MCLEPLELVVRRKIRIFVVQMYDKPNGDEILPIVVKERATTGAIIERPAERMLN
jgi:hypothetical protein